MSLLMVEQESIYSSARFGGTIVVKNCKRHGNRMIRKHQN